MFPFRKEIFVLWPKWSLQLEVEMTLQCKLQEGGDINVLDAGGDEEGFWDKVEKSSASSTIFNCIASCDPLARQITKAGEAGEAESLHVPHQN